MAFSVSLGHHPVGMNKAVMIPHAMNMEMFDMTIPERNLPKVWSLCFMILSSFFLSDLILSAESASGNERRLIFGIPLSVRYSRKMALSRQCHCAMNRLRLMPCQAI